MDKRYRFMIFVMIVGLAVNCFILLTHPAFRFWKEASVEIQRRQLLFERHIVSEIIPAFSNSFERIVRPSPTFDGVLSCQNAAMTNNAVFTDATNLVIDCVRLFDDSFISRSYRSGDKVVSEFTLYGRRYRLGDRFEFETITDIEQDGFATSRQRYIVDNKMKGSHGTVLD